MRKLKDLGEAKAMELLKDYLTGGEISAELASKDLFIEVRVVTNALKSLGYRRIIKKINGKRARIWVNDN